MKEAIKMITAGLRNRSYIECCWEGIAPSIKCRFAALCLLVDLHARRSKSFDYLYISRVKHFSVDAFLDVARINIEIGSVR